MFRRLYEFFNITKTVKDVVQDFKRKDLQPMRHNDIRPQNFWDQKQSSRGVL